MKKISFERAKQILEYNKNSILLDVREESEYVVGHADGAVLFPVDTINEETSKKIISTKDCAVLIYCRSGRRSQIAGERLEALGYKNVFDLGGLSGWPYGITWGI